MTVSTIYLNIRRTVNFGILYFSIADNLLWLEEAQANWVIYGIALNCYFLPEVKKYISVGEINTVDLLRLIIQGPHHLSEKILDKELVCSKIEEDHCKWSNGDTKHFKENTHECEYLRNILLRTNDEPENAEKRKATEKLKQMLDVCMLFRCSYCFLYVLHLPLKAVYHYNSNVKII